tara:strand:- start:228 stop:1283 length:1056 start_codon:yes stop_codon:yes gene_type:complete
MTQEKDPTQTSSSGRRPTIREVALAADTSIGTVSRVLNGNSKVAKATKLRVMDAIRSTGYQLNIAAQMMRTKRSMTIGLLIPDIVSPTFSKIAAGAEAVLSEEGYLLLVASANRRVDSEIGFINAAVQRQMDGLILSLTNEKSTDILDVLSSLKTPTLILDRDIPIDCDVIFSEHAETLRQAVEHLTNLGHRRIGYVGASQDIRPGRERVRGLKRGLEQASIELDQNLIRTGQQGPHYGEVETSSLLMLDNPPTALIAGTGDIFPGALRAIRTMGLKIPDDISIIGVDETSMADLIDPPITVVARDMVQFGQAAAQLLLERIKSPDAIVKRLVLTSELIYRHSTARPPSTR